LLARKPAVIAEDRESVRFTRVCRARKLLLKMPILSAGCRAVGRAGIELLWDDGAHTPAWGVARKRCGIDDGALCTPGETQVDVRSVSWTFCRSPFKGGPGLIVSLH
jgi:hypothetical protein